LTILIIYNIWLFNKNVNIYFFIHAEQNICPAGQEKTSLVNSSLSKQHPQVFNLPIDLAYKHNLKITAKIYLSILNYFK